MKHLIERLLQWAASIGADPADDDDIRLQKSLLALCSIPFIFAGIGWGLMYILFGEPVPGMIPLSYAFISLVSIIHFGFTRKYRFFRFSQLSLILLLPFFLMLSLGGYINGSAVILWALICPLGALLFDKYRNALYWFIAFVALVVLSGLLQPYLVSTNNISPNWKIFLFVLNFIGVSSIIFLMVYYFVAQKNLFQEKSESLLLNILPKEIASILKNETRTIADHFDGASILFADVENFTHLTAQMTATELVELLNELFSHFDMLVKSYGLEKIKTIGDCYMLAAGVPRSRKDHAQALTRIALNMLEYVNGRVFNGRRLTFRIGINSGSVIAGVIGRNKFIYDLWGDAVNTASRMESHGKGGIIQITRATYELVKDEFLCEPQGKVYVKGKGEMEVWFVRGERGNNYPK